MSGLPRVPTNLSPKNLLNPYVDYTAERLYEFLGTYTLAARPRVEVGIFEPGRGTARARPSRRAGIDYETLVRLRICGPLDMTSTYATRAPELKSRAATGHNRALQPIANWDFDVLAGAGAFWSDAGDLLEFVAANLGEKKSGLAPAMAAMLKVAVRDGIGQMSARRWAGKRIQRGRDLERRRDVRLQQLYRLRSEEPARQWWYCRTRARRS